MFRVRLRILSHENFFESPKLERSVSESGVTDSTTMLPLHFFKRNPTETEEIETPTSLVDIQVLFAVNFAW